MHDNVWRGTRRLAAGGAAAVFAPPLKAATRAPLLAWASLVNRLPYVGDGPSLATVGTAPGRTAALVRFRLDRRASVVLETLVTGQGTASEQVASVGQATLETEQVSVGPGVHSLTWTPDPALPARTYILRLRATPAGAAEATSSARFVVRLLGVDAAFAARSAAPGELADLTVRTDAQSLTMQVLRCGPEGDPTYADDELNGVPVAGPFFIDWSKNTDRPGPLAVGVESWPSGLYAVRLDANDGRVGFAPLVVRPSAPTQRIAVVLPSSTWQAYNFYDADGDGWGDTWYAHWTTQVVDLSRPHADRGVPYRFRSYDLSFLHWLHQTGKDGDVDVYADEDLERFETPDALRRAYDLLVFPGHTEYVTERVYDLVTGFRDQGGNLAFLSANNFFRRVDRSGEQLTLIDEWRDLGRPEAALCGVQYIASDRGERHEPFTVAGADAAPWAFAGTGLENGSQFGLYGIEIDARTAKSPVGTQLLATIPDLFGPGRSAEMTYYEHWSGARVFSAGALNFGGQILLWPETAQLLENIWQRLAP